MKNKKNTGVIILIASLLLAVMFMETGIMFRMTSNQTKESGIYQLEKISAELESAINEARNLTMEYALQAQMVVEDKDALETFIREKREELQDDGTGAYNVYIAGTGWDIILDLNKPKGFVATERTWYTGAIRSGGKAYVTEPYKDALTDNICYTVSVMLGDKDTVLGIDYTMETLQSHIAQMYATGSRNAVIVTGEGIIAGCADETMIASKLNDVLPEYAGIFSLARNSDSVVTGRIRSDFLYENLFAAKSGNEWYLIVSESDWEMYHNSYIQLVITIVLSLALFAVIILLYLLTVRNQKRAEKALASKEEFLSGITGELREPLTRILESSGKGHGETVEDIEVTLSRIHNAGERLSEMIGQIISYSSIVRTETKEKEKDPKHRLKNSAMNRRFRTIILAFLGIVMLISLYTNISVTYQWGSVLMKSEAENYEFQLTEWINTQKSILDMFCSVISTHPEMLDDYEGTVDYLNRITVQYPEISVTYMTNPELEHTVYMNNGWEPENDWHVEERQWYIDTIESKTGWNISAPYYDEQTGGYCVTISERVYDARTGEFLGNFGIDFFMDKLVDILGNSYSNTGYAFLVDTDGVIINHPYGSYQMSLDRQTKISELPYGEVQADGGSTMILRDYDDTFRIFVATHSKESRFTVYVASTIGKIYGRVFLYGLICLVTFIGCMIFVYRLLTSLITWQDQTNQQMKEAADAAIAAGKAKSQFLAQMSHEIRTPINAVLGMNEMILRESEDEEILDYAGNIRSAGRTLLSLINSILDFSKIEDGKMEIIPVQYDLAELIHNLINSISERAKAKNLDFVVEVDENLPAELMGDDVRISQVIMNLLTNAVKYTESGNVVLSIRGADRTDDSIELSVEVRDTGIGIRQEDMSKLFESFERLEEKRNRNIEGTGLGMSIVTKLLGMMGSKLLVDSVYGEGSSFSFRLRQKIMDDKPIGDYTKRLEAGRKKEKNDVLHIEGAKVLVVDDNNMNLKVVKNLMKLCGIVPDMVMSGFEAIDQLRDHAYDIVFLDHMMPKMDGIETLEKIREEKLDRDGMTMIALTANAVVGARETYLEAGFDDYLSKPIEMEELERKLVRYLPPEMVSYRPAEKSGKEPRKVDVGGAGTAVSGAETGTAMSGVETGTTVSGAETGTAASNAGTGTETTDAGNATGTGAGIAASNAGTGTETTDVGNATGTGTDTERAPEDVHSALAAIGISVEDGLRYCADSKDFYLEMLSDYAEAYVEKTFVLQAVFQNKDWNNYRIHVHALKSTSKSVGINEMFEQARELEAAAKEADGAYIEEHHPILMELYTKTVEELGRLLPLASGLPW